MATPGGVSGRPRTSGLQLPRSGSVRPAACHQTDLPPHPSCMPTGRAPARLYPKRAVRHSRGVLGKWRDLPLWAGAGPSPTQRQARPQQDFGVGPRHGDAHPWTVTPQPPRWPRRRLRHLHRPLLPHTEPRQDLGLHRPQERHHQSRRPLQRDRPSVYTGRILNGTGKYKESTAPSLPAQPHTNHVDPGPSQERTVRTSA